MSGAATEKIYHIGATERLPDPSRDGKICEAKIVMHQHGYAVAEFTESGQQVFIRVNDQKLKYYGDDE